MSGFFVALTLKHLISFQNNAWIIGGGGGEQNDFEKEKKEWSDPSFVNPIFLRHGKTQFLKFQLYQG